jgi:hypothetical protein
MTLHTDGLYHGASDFAYAAYSTVLIYNPTLSRCFYLITQQSFVMLTI